jgi:hypothetical protein
MTDEPEEEECGVEVVADPEPGKAETFRLGFQRAAARAQERLDMHASWAKLVRRDDD